MKPIHLLAGLLCPAAIALDLAVLSSFSNSYVEPLSVFLGLSLGQLALLAMWCVLGSGWLPVRLATLAGVALLLSRPLSQLTSGSWPHWFTLQCLFATSIAGLILAGRATNWLHGATPSPNGEEGSSEARRHQFSLAGLFSLLTATGMVLGIGGTCRSRFTTKPHSGPHCVPVDRGNDRGLGGRSVVTISATAAADRMRCRRLGYVSNRLWVWPVVLHWHCRGTGTLHLHEPVGPSHMPNALHSGRAPRTGSSLT